MRTEIIRQGSRVLVKGDSWICLSCSIAGKLKANNNIRNDRKKRGFSSSSSSSSQSVAARDGKLPDYPARTRFAPSPTGIMHIGGLRTALFSYLLARRTGGQFILRIEDTDQKRYVPGSIERLCEDLKWAGLQWDEGPLVGGEFGPYQQSHRTEIYQRHATELLDQGTAYRCFCHPQTDATKTTAYISSGCYQDCSSLHPDQSKERALTKHERFTVRLKVPPDAHRRKYPDLIYGNIKRLKRSPGASISSDQDAPDAGDTILVKSDGTPTYHFANVVDDHLMKITHVIRGTEWMASTPLHYDLYHAFGWQPPLFAHVGLLLDKTKAKLSKRNADQVLDVRGLQSEHDVLPETLCNFLALQGWSNQTRNDVMDMKELIHNFDLKFTSGNTMVGFEKLWYLQKHHMARRIASVGDTGDISAVQDIVNKIVGLVQNKYPHFEARYDLADLCTMLLLADDKSFQSASQFVDRNHYIFDFNDEKVPVSGEAGTDDIDGLIVDILDQIEAHFDVESNARPLSIAERWAQLQRDASLAHDMFVETIWSSVLGTGTTEKLRSVLVNTTDAEQAAAALQTDKSEAEKLLKEYRTRQTSLLRRLRQVMCCGSPGPSIGMIIAFLGAAECKRRLRVVNNGL